MPSDSSLAGLFTRFGILNEETLQRCIFKKKELAAQGKRISLSQIVIDFGYAHADLVVSLIADGSVILMVCPKCEAFVKIEQFASNHRYACEECECTLAFASDENLDEHAQGESKGPEDLVGLELGAYRILHTIGYGDMSTVYMGERMADQTKVAIKLMAARLREDEKMRIRFAREAEAGQRLDHPNVAKVMDAGELDGRPYLIAEYIDGEALDTYLLEGIRFRPRRAVMVMEDVLSGLQHAHDNGIVHRDLKPANIILQSTGRAMIIDFGLAKDEMSAEVITVEGHLLGTPSYMSPEQAEGGRGDHLSDIYSCGAICYSMVTGTKPFLGKDLQDLLRKVVESPAPSMVGAFPEVPLNLDVAVRKMMAKNPEDRPQSAMEAMASLKASMNS